MTGTAARSQQPQPGEPTPTDEGAPRAFFSQPEAPDTWTADAAYPADLPVPYTLTAEAETLLGETASPTYLLRNTHTCGMGTRPPQTQPGLSGQSQTYVTKIAVPPSDSGIQRLHSHMKEPEPEPEAGL